MRCRPSTARLLCEQPRRMEGAPMTVASLLARKGVKVITIEPDQQIRQALALLADHNIGAVVVVDPAARPIGILSERDILRTAVRDDRGVVGRPVRTLLTRNVL